jgi:hypothetical protein
MIRNKSPTVDELLEGSLSKEDNREYSGEWRKKKEWWKDGMAKVKREVKEDEECYKDEEWHKKEDRWKEIASMEENEGVRERRQSV